VWVKRLAPWVIAGLILVWLFARIPMDGVLEALEKVSQWQLVALSAAAVAAILAADSLTLWLAFRASLPETPFGVGAVVLMRGASYVLAALSWGVGQVGLVWLLRRRHQVSIAAATGAVFLASAALLVVIGAAVGAGLVAHDVPDRPELRWAALVLLAGVPFYLVIIALRPRLLAERALLRPLFDAGLTGTALIAGARVLHLLVMVGGHYLALRMFAIDVPPQAALARIPVLLLVSALPIAPSGLGTGQAAAVTLFATYAPGATDEERAATVLAYSLSYHVICTIFVFLVGIGCLRATTRDS
jgi:uncharacterized membrane protein YbhN (UPF0104 family)